MRSISPIVVNGLVLFAYLAFGEHPQRWPAYFEIWPWALYVLYVSTIHYAFSRLCVAESAVQRHFYRLGTTLARERIASVVYLLTQPAANVYAAVSVFTSVASFTGLCFFQGWLTAVSVHVLGSLILPRILPIRHGHHLRKIRDGVMTHSAGVRLELVALGLLASDFLETIETELLAAHCE